MSPFVVGQLSEGVMVRGRVEARLEVARDVVAEGGWLLGVWIVRATQLTRSACHPKRLFITGGLQAMEEALWQTRSSVRPTRRAIGVVMVATVAMMAAFGVVSLVGNMLGFPPVRDIVYDAHLQFLNRDHDHQSAPVSQQRCARHASRGSPGASS